MSAEPGHEQHIPKALGFRVVCHHIPLSLVSIRFPNLEANMNFQQKVRLQYPNSNDRPFNCMGFSRVLYGSNDRDPTILLLGAIGWHLPERSAPIVYMKTVLLAT